MSSSWDFVKDDIYRLYGKRVNRIEKLGGYGDKFNFVATSTDDGNLQQKFVFKVKFFKLDLKKDDTQNRLLLHLKNKNFTVPNPYWKREDVDYKSLEIYKYVRDRGLSEHVCYELIDYVPGEVFAFVKFSDLNEIKHVSRNFGSFVASVVSALEDFECDEDYGIADDFPFYLHNSHLIRGKTHLLGEESVRTVVEKILDQFQAEVMPKLPRLKKGAIHGDLNDLNVTVLSSQLATEPQATPSSARRAFGAFDFEDSHRGFPVFELAVAVAYHVIKLSRDGVDDAWRWAGHVIAAYHHARPLGSDEFEMLYLSVGARLCASLVESLTHPPELERDNPVLFLQSRMCRPLLRQMEQLGRDRIVSMWREQMLSFESA